MVEDLSQRVNGTTTPNHPRQATTGLTPPQLGEATIREVFPTLIDGSAPVANLAATLIKSIFLAPLGWLLLAPLFAKRLLPFACKRYTLTNRRVMIQHGLQPSPGQEVKLDDIDDVRLAAGSANAFFRCGTIEVLSKEQVALTLTGVPEPEGFRLAILNAVRAWAPGKARAPFIPASATK